MINKNYKTIHNKYLRFVKFFFFLRYVFAIFLISILLFLLIPKLFNYDKKQKVIKEYLSSYYDLELNDYSLIQFKVFPFPNLSIKNVKLKVKDKPIIFNTKNFNIFLNLKNIYNYKDFTAKKILLNNNTINLDIDETNYVLEYFQKLKNKLDIKKLNLNLKKEKKSIIEIKKITFSNYGYKKNKIIGEIFDKKFELYLDTDNKDLSFKILETGIKANFNLYETDLKNLISGTSKISILSNLIKFDFIMRNNQLEVKKGNLRNKDLSISFNSLIKFNPFFEINSDIRINKIDTKLINNLSLEKILKKKEVLKKFNSDNKINYNNKRLYKNLIKSNSLELDLAHGRLSFLNIMTMSGGSINCKGDSLLTEEYPRLNFDCLFEIKNKQNFLKNFLISKKIDQDQLNLNVIGSLNLFNKKINFEKINTDTNYIAKEEEISFFKESFEKFLFKEGFFDIFKINKIKEFLLEVI